MPLQLTQSPNVQVKQRPSLSARSSAARTNHAVVGTLNDFVAGFSEQVAIVDANWIIVAVNRAWKQMVNVGGYPELVPGTDYRDFLETFAARGHENASAVLAGVRKIDRGDTDTFEFTYAGVDQWQGRTLHLRIHRLRFDGQVVATIAREDVTDSSEIDRVRQDCAAAILSSETQARERLTRELHDSTAQLVTSIGLLSGVLKQKVGKADAVGLINEIQELASQAACELRSISHLTQAPKVGEIGIVQALDGLAAGFGRRANLDVCFQSVGTRARLPLATKTIVYRIAQEALSNVFRHARATHVDVRLAFRRNCVHLVVADDGIGVSTETLAGTGKAGVGICGMRSRMAEAGGRLSVRRLRRGTAIVASLPVSKAAG